MGTRGPDNNAGKDRYDVVILGTGLAGATLGAILARAGRSVLLVDAASHPRFAVGESTVGYTLVHLRMLAHRYGVPELGHMGSLGETIKHIGSSSGLKRHFGFMIHEEGREPDPDHVNQFRLPKCCTRRCTTTGRTPTPTCSTPP